MKIGFGARLAYEKEPAQTLYYTELLNSLCKLGTAQDLLYIFTDKNCTINIKSFVTKNKMGIESITSLFPIRRQSVGLIWEQTVLPLHIQMKKLDLYHSPFFFLPLTKINSKTRMAVTIHDLAFERNPEHFSPLTKIYFNRLARKSAQIADVIFTPCNFVKNDIVDLYKIKSEKIIITPYALNPIYEKGQNINVDNPEFKKPYILVVGVIHPRKNLGQVVEAFAKIKDRFKSHSLIFVGRKALRSEEIEIAVRDAKLTERSFFYSNLSSSLMPSIYKNAECLIMPSFSEGFGFPALEAMAVTTPVIAANQGSLPEILGDYATYFNPFAKDLAEVLESFLSSGRNLKEQQRLAQIQLEKFNWDKTAKTVMDSYRSLC